jgi:hypothetical protein
MCCEDIAIGRASPTSEHTETVGAASTMVISASPARIALILCAPLSGTLTYTTRPIAVAGDGIVLIAGGSPLTLTVKDYGSMVRARWMAIADGAGRQATVFATELPLDKCDDRI